MSLVYPKPKQKRRRPSKAQMEKAKEILKRFKQQRRDKKQLEDAIKNNPDVWDAEKFEEMEREKKRRKRDVKQPKGSI
jgi:hypothetical protein